MAQKSKPDLRAVRQKKLIERLRKKENWMKWGLIGALVLIILLLLFLGYVTDWGMGLKKTTTPLQPDSSQTSDESSGASGRSATGQSGSNTTTRSSSTTNTERLFSETNLGGNVQDTIDSANQLGVDAKCTDQVVVKECTFTGGDQTITTKSVNDVITSVVEQ